MFIRGDDYDEIKGDGRQRVYTTADQERLRRFSRETRVTILSEKRIRESRRERVSVQNIIKSGRGKTKKRDICRGLVIRHLANTSPTPCGILTKAFMFGVCIVGW